MPAYRETPTYVEWYNPRDGQTIFRINESGEVQFGALSRVTLPNAGNGTDYFVDPTGDDNNSGTSWSQPLATVQAAVNKCTSGAGDRIYVKPGTYEEEVSVSEKDYVSIIGVALNGYGRPDIISAAGVVLTVNLSQGFVAKNIRFANDGFDADVARVEGNGFVFEDCVFDGEATMGATKALLRLWCDAADDGYTASEGRISRCLFRNSPGYGIAADVQHATVGVGPTHNVVEDCRFLANTAEDIIALETAAGTYSMQDWLVARCYFMSKNKATHIDISTNNGATNTGNVFAGCYFFDDTIDTTAIKAAGTGSGFIGCASLDGIFDGDALD